MRIGLSNCGVFKITGVTYNEAHNEVTAIRTSGHTIFRATPETFRTLSLMLALYGYAWMEMDTERTEADGEMAWYYVSTSSYSILPQNPEPTIYARVIHDD